MRLTENTNNKNVKPTNENPTDIIKFMKAVAEHMPEKRGVTAYCRCPLCKGVIEMYRVEYNGHIRACCDTCGKKMIS